MTTARPSDRLYQWLETQSPWGRLIFQSLHADRMSPAEVARTLGAEVTEIESWQQRIRSATQSIVRPN